MFLLSNSITSIPPSDSCKGKGHTLGILAPADLDELLDIGDFGRHLDGVVCDGEMCDCCRGEIVNFCGSRSICPGLASIGVRKLYCFGNKVGQG